MAGGTNRRKFLKTTTAAGAGFWIANSYQTALSKLANERLRFGCIGVKGKGESDTADAARHGDIVAICDIDENRLGEASLLYKNAKKFVDFRKMLDECRDNLDAVTVSTPDHTHAPASLMAMRLGKHCFCQKPLTHSIYEARLMGTVAREKKLATQMGNQGTADSDLRKAAAVLRSGALGEVKELHVWTNRAIWPQGIERPAPKTAPSHVHWDLFLGPAPYRPYSDGYHPFAWRGWWDFGTGALGDMACHTMNMPNMGLDLRNPTSVQAISSGHNGDSYPSWAVIRYEFSANDSRGPLVLYWYEGGVLPAKRLFQVKEPDKFQVPESGALVTGSKGQLFSPGDYADTYQLLGDVSEPTVTIEESPGHFEEWVNAIRGGKPAASNFPDYAGPLTETVLLGNLAIFANKRVEWNATSMEPTNAPELMSIVKPTYREGYTL